MQKCIKLNKNMILEEQQLYISGILGDGSVNKSGSIQSNSVHLEYMKNIDNQIKQLMAEDSYYRRLFFNLFISL